MSMPSLMLSNATTPADFLLMVRRGLLLQFLGTAGLTRSYDLVVGTFNVLWDLFQVLFSGFISGSEGWGGSSRGWFFEYVLVSFFFINFS